MKANISIASKPVESDHEQSIGSGWIKLCSISFSSFSFSRSWLVSARALLAPPLSTQHSALKSQISSSLLRCSTSENQLMTAENKTMTRKTTFSPSALPFISWSRLDQFVYTAYVSDQSMVWFNGLSIQKWADLLSRLQHWTSPKPTRMLRTLLGCCCAGAAGVDRLSLLAWLASFNEAKLGFSSLSCYLPSSGPV